MTDESPAALRELSREAYAAAARAIKAGDVKLARELSKLAVQLAADAEGLTDGNNPGIITDVTSAQIDRRGRAVAVAKARKSTSPVRAAIVASQWKTLGAYAPRCKVSQGTLSKYINGDLSCPAPVADRVKKDFGLGYDVWPKGVVE